MREGIAEKMKHLDRFLQRWRIHKALPYIAQGSRLLDIGTADGALFRMFPGLRDSAGIDMELEHGKLPNLPHVRFYQGLFPDDLPAPSTFDVITMLATLEHIPADRLDALAAACAEHLRPGGHLIITVPSPAVDSILPVLQRLGLIDGMSTEQHHGFDVRQTPAIFESKNFTLVTRRSFQLGLNHLFVFTLADPVPVVVGAFPVARQSQAELAESHHEESQ